MNSGREKFLSESEFELSWMMQSDQVSSRQLIEALVGRFGVRLTRLAARITCTKRGSPESQTLLVDTIAHAVAGRHRYWGDTPLYRWIARVMLKQWKRKDRDMVHSACTDYLAFSDLVDRVDVVTREAAAKRNTWRVVLKAGAGVALFLLFLGFSTISRQISVPTPRLATSTPFHSRGAYNLDDSYRTGYFDYQYSATSGETLEMIAYQAGVNADQIKYGFDDRAAPEFITDGTQLKIPSSGRLRQSLFAPPPPLAFGLPLLTKDSSPEEVQARIDRKDTWSTLKAKYNYLMDTYVSGYAGPVGQMMELVLLAKGPDLYTVIAGPGPSTSRSSEIFIMNRADGINFNLQPQDKQIWGSFGPDQILSYLSGTAWYYPQDVDYAIKVVGEGQSAGRPAVIIEEQVEQNVGIRMWIDAQTGFTLRWQLASGFNNYFQSFVVTSIEYNVEIAPEWLDPGRPWWDITMEDVNVSFNFPPLGDEPPDWLEYRHLEPNPQEPPPGFMVRSAPLTLQWPGDWNEYLKPPEAGQALSPSTDELYSVEIYASDYLLGTINLEIARLQSCLRSPDGRRLALVGVKPSQEEMLYDSYHMTMYLLRLDRLPQIEAVDFVTDVGQYAFSPNSHKLAWTGCSSRNGCGFHLYDFSSGVWDSIGLKDSGDYVSALGWSSDSQTIGYVVQKSSFYESSTCMVFSINTLTGSENLEKTDIDCALGKLELKSLGYVVGKDPVIDGCIYP